jgi:hypothetical protein
MPYKETEDEKAIVVSGRLTGPLGIWGFPLLVMLAQYFPWAKKLLTIIATNGK